MIPDNELRRPRKTMPTGFEVRKLALAHAHKSSRRNRHASTIALAICILLFLAAVKGCALFNSTFFQP